MSSYSIWYLRQFHPLVHCQADQWCSPPARLHPLSCVALQARCHPAAGDLRQELLWKYSHNCYSYILDRTCSQTPLLTRTTLQRRLTVSLTFCTLVPVNTWLIATYIPSILTEGQKNVVVLCSLTSHVANLARTQPVTPQGIPRRSQVVLKINAFPYPGSDCIQPVLVSVGMSWTVHLGTCRQMLRVFLK